MSSKPNLDPKWLQWSKQLMAIAQNGLTFVNNPFDKERYEAVRAVAAEILSDHTGSDSSQIVDLFSRESGYATPKVDVVVAHNLIFDNASYGVLMRTITDRQAGGKRVETSRNQILNNLFVNHADGLMNLPYPNARSQRIVSDNNVFWSDAAAAQPFAINCYQDEIQLRDVAGELRRRLEQFNTADQQVPDPDGWAKNPRLTLNSWRLLLERDRGSQHLRVAVRCEDGSLPARLALTLDAAIAKVPCTRVEGLSADFRGQPFPADAPLPGSFQGLRSGENEIVLDPSPERSP